MAEKVPVQCQDNPCGFNGVMVFGDETYGMTLGCRCRNGFNSRDINADHRNDAQASSQMLPVNVAVTVSAISAPMNTHNQLGGRRMDTTFTGGYILQPFMDGEEISLSFGREMNNVRRRRRRRIRV